MAAQISCRNCLVSIFSFLAASKESPEIDILIHRSDIPTVYRLDDLVIAHAKAVRGVIQVKKTLDDSQFKKGIDNTVTAMRHIASAIPGSGPKLSNCCSMVVGFNPGLPGLVSLKSAIENAVCAPIPTRDDDIASLMPSLIGSLQEGFYLKRFCKGGKISYFRYPSIHEDKNYFVQVMLYCINGTIFFGQAPYPLNIPDGLRETEELIVYEKASPLPKPSAS